MGGKSSGSNKEAAAARADEQARQAQIRGGTARINSIFDGGTVGTGVAEGAYDPSKSYFNADGSAWTPSYDTSGGTGVLAKSGILNGKVQQLADRNPANAFAQAQKAGSVYSGVQSSGGFNEDFYKSRRDAFTNYATPQLEQQKSDAQKELTFALTRGGNLNSSVRAQKTGDLETRYNLNKQQIADQALASEGETRNAVEDARANLIATLNATGDATGAVNSSMARASALSKPAAFSPLANLFGDFTATLGTQAALEKANAYSGGQTGARYSTGLFGPSANSVKVT